MQQLWQQLPARKNARSRYEADQQKLMMNQEQIGVNGLRVIAQMGLFSNLRILYLGQQQPGQRRGCGTEQQRLVSAERALHMPEQHNQRGSDALGQGSLAATGHLLPHTDSNFITREGFETLVCCHLPQMRELSLWENQLAAIACNWLAKTNWSSLHTLYLWKNQMDGPMKERIEPIWSARLSMKM